MSNESVLTNTCAKAHYAILVKNKWSALFDELTQIAGCREGRVLLGGLSFYINTIRPRQNDRLFADDNFKRIFSNENNRISVKISLKFVPKGLINNIPALVLIMAWRQPGDKPLSEPMMVKSLTNICVTRPQWVKSARQEHMCIPNVIPMAKHKTTVTPLLTHWSQSFRWSFMVFSGNWSANQQLCCWDIYQISKGWNHTLNVATVSLQEILWQNIPLLSE